MTSKPIYVATFISINPQIILSYNDVINLIYTRYPNSQLYLEKYYVSELEPNVIINYLNDFLQKYPEGRRAIITLETVNVILIKNYLNNIQIDIPIFSTYSTSPIIKTLSNVLTYAPSDKYSVMSLFLKYVDYGMEQIKILNNKNISAFARSYINEIKTQSNYLGINVDNEAVEEGKSDYGIKPKTMIVIILATSLIKKLVTKEFLELIPDGCFIALTDANVNMTDIFENVPTFVMSPYPIDYTESTVIVYNSLTDKNNYPYHVFCFFDLLYSLNFYTSINDELNITNFINVNPFQSGVSPAFIAAQSNFNPKINGYDYGVYQSIFTKNSLVQNNNQLFEKYNQGGTLSLPDSNSIFKTVGIVPFFNINIFYGDEDYYKIYDECGNLIVTRFASSVTNFPLKQNSRINIAQHVENKFYCKYTTDGYFSYLEKVFNVFGSNPQVNLTMGKQPINKVFVLN